MGVGQAHRAGGGSEETVNAPLNHTALRGLLADHGVPVAGELDVTQLTGGRSNLTFRVSDGVSNWVVRRPPISGVTASAHDVVREYRIITALQNTAVPVAKPIACDPDGSATGSPLTVVDYVPGLTIRSERDLDALTNRQVQAAVSALIATLSAVHDVDYADIGLGTLGRPNGFVARQVQLWSRQWEQVKTRDLRDVERLAQALNDRPAPAGVTCLVHGDFRIDNALISPRSAGEVLAVIDWEMSTLGDPLTDIALACAYRNPDFDRLLGMPAAWTSARLPAPDEIAEQYAQISGRDLIEWDYYLALAYFKIAVIAEGITYRYRQGADAGNAANDAATATPAYAAAGLRILQPK
ncbi:phosphotransferase family protein (plasmid) [Mycolicibacterium psychrotolerans]|uniref:phosphotransferase family protein n=1 Tax=Mycolicibacterium psychrotolerans TaxID=216929 RepID=UPI003D6736B6